MVDKFLDGVKIESVKASIDAGIILPRLYIELDKIVTVKILGNLHSFETDFGTTWSIDVLFDGMKHNLIVPTSLKYQLIVEILRKGLAKDFESLKTLKETELIEFLNSVLENRTITVKKSTGNTKQYKNAELYAVEIID